MAFLAFVRSADTTDKERTIVDMVIVVESSFYTDDVLDL